MRVFPQKPPWDLKEIDLIQFPFLNTLLTFKKKYVIIDMLLENSKK